MAGLNISQVREAVKKALSGAAFARTVAVHAYDPHTDPEAHHQYPCVIMSIGDDGIQYRTTFGARGVAQLALRLEVRTPDGPDGEKMMDDLLSAGTGATSSLFDALAADETFAGTIASGVALSVTAPRRLTNGTSNYWSATYTLTVNQPRS
jgi:hypothetical protein